MLIKTRISIWIGAMLFCSFGGLNAAAQQQYDTFTDHVLAHENMSRYKVYLLKLMKDESICRELSITQNQIDRANRIFNDCNLKRDKMFETPRNFSTKEEEDFHRAVKESYRASHESILNVLSSEQQRRLAQVAFQSHLSSRRSLEMYLHRSLQQFIDFDEDSYQELQKEVTDANRNYLKDLAALNEKYHRRLIRETAEKLGERKAGKLGEVIGPPWMRFHVKGTSVLENKVGK